MAVYIHQNLAARLLPNPLGELTALPLAGFRGFGVGWEREG